MEIAVIGIACRYPGAASAREFFENILSGRRYFREVPPERWSLDDYYDPDRSRPDRTYCKQAAVLEGFEFNASAFRIPQSTYKATDLAQWLALTVAKDALDDADVGEPPRPRTAVILGNTLTGETSRAHLVRYRWPYARRVFVELLESLSIVGAEREEMLARVEERYKRPFPPVNEDNLAGGLANTIAGRICNYFDFKGGGYTVDGACSSSLLSIQEATIGLDQGLCDLALAGGVDMSLDPFEMVGFAKVGALSDSDIRVYDQRANGFLPGEGCGIVVLKRLQDAIRDDNRIYSVIRGVGYSSDGRGGITAPSVAGQSLAVDRAYSMAGYSFADVELIEGHGTGTPVGDRTELQTFFEAKTRHGAKPEHRCGIGSIKSMIGHTKAAAGVAGFIKASLAVYHRVLPPTMGLGIPNDLFATNSHVYPLMRGGSWRSSGPARAAISSAGFGGINTHITVQSHGSVADAARRSTDAEYLLQSHQNAELFLLAADDAADMYSQVTELAPVAKRLCHAELADLAAHCARSVATKPLRLAVVADSAAGLHEKLMKVASQLSAHSGAASQIDWSDAANGLFMRRARKMPRVAFMYPGQGVQTIDMSRSLRERYAFLAGHWRMCDEALNGKLAGSLSSRIFSEQPNMDAAEERERNTVLRETALAQPAIVAASMATTEALRYLGIEPDVVLGHSLGEYTALWCAGALDKAEVLRLVAERGAAMAQPATAGGMISVATDADKVRELIAGVDGLLVIANYNAPTQTVVSGEHEALEALSQLCAIYEIPTTHLSVSGPFHSPLVEGAQQRLREVLPKQHWQALRRLFISTTTGELVSSIDEAIAALRSQIVSPVLFSQAVQTALGEGVDVLIDVGPGPVLCGLSRRILGDRTALAFTADIGLGGDWTGWLQTIGHAFVWGLPIIPTRLFENRFVRPFKWPYQPRFITSPCEFDVEPLQLQHRSVGLARVSPVTLPETTSTAAAAKPDVSRTPEGLFEFIRALIMQRFGYPAELIAPGTRLLEDLNLDSIKSAEVIGEAMSHVGVHAEPSVFAALPLGEMAARLAAQAHAPMDATSQPRLPDHTPTWVRAFAARLAEQPLGPQVRDLPTGRIVLAATADDASAAAVLAQLQARGLTAQLWRQGESLQGNGEIVGCLVLIPQGSRAARGGNDLIGAFGHRPFDLPDFLLDTSRVVCTQFFSGSGGDATTANRPFLAAVVRSGSLLGHGSHNGALDIGPASAAFIKSWYLEHPTTETRVIDMDRATTAAAVVDTAMDELTAGSGFVECAYTRNGRRHIVEYVPVPTALMSPASPTVNDSDVMIVTGGAKGITAECLRALVDCMPFTVAVFGSSPAPSISTAASDSGSDEISRTLAALAASGVAARYYQCDVTDEAAVRACVGRVNRELGPVRGLIHAAGINVPHRLDDLSLPAFHSVLSPKMLGLVNLLSNLDLPAMRQLVLFSSVIGASGMAGNADYAYANAWMGLVLRWLATSQPQMQCRAFSFSVWDEVGMGARLGSVGALRRMGISAIPRAQGIERFVELMRRQWRTTELVITARAGGIGTLRFADPPSSLALPFAHKPLLFHPGIELVVESTLDPGRDRYLQDHNYKGALLLPAVVGMEAMAQVAMRCVKVLLHDDRAPILENLLFIRPIVVPVEGRQIRILALADEPLQDGTLRVHVEVRSSLDGYAAAAFTGDCVWRGTQSVRKVMVTPAWPPPLPVDPRQDLYGSLLFQGPIFQHVVALHDISSTHCIAQVGIPTSTEDIGATPGSVLGMASVRDCFLHIIQACVPEYRILPIGIESIETHGFDGDCVFMIASERSRTKEEFIYDIDVVSEEGKVVEQLRGYRCRIIDRFGDQQTLERIRRIHDFAVDRHLPRLATTRH